MARVDYVYADLDKPQWAEVIGKVADTPAVLFVLRCWANCQAVAAGQISAFQGAIEDQAEANQRGARVIGQISRQVRSLDGQPPTAAPYIWNPTTATWSTGYYNAEALRDAFAARGA